MYTVPPRHAWTNTSFGLFLSKGQLAFVKGERILSIVSDSPSLPNTHSTFLRSTSLTAPWLKINITKHWSFCRLLSRLRDVTFSIISCTQFIQHNANRNQLDGVVMLLTLPLNRPQCSSFIFICQMALPFRVANKKHHEQRKSNPN